MPAAVEKRKKTYNRTVCISRKTVQAWVVAAAAAAAATALAIAAAEVAAERNGHCKNAMHRQSIVAWSKPSRVCVCVQNDEFRSSKTIMAKQKKKTQPPRELIVHYLQQ